MESNNNKLKSIIQSFKYESNEENQPLKQTKQTLTRSPIKKSPNKKSPSKPTKSKSSILYPEEYKDLQPSIKPNLTVLFIGYNPGVESSIKQHHYAHFTNLFWKLFNQSKLISKVLIDNDDLENNDELKQLLIDGKAKPEHDFKLINYNIGFTDLVLRCTRSATELTINEKLENVPRLISEFKFSKCKSLVFVGKGIWEIITKYLTKLLDISKFKLTKVNFKWGLQSMDKNNQDIEYRVILRKFIELCDYNPKVYVFPNTSGLVTSLTFQEKLQLWVEMGNDLKT